MPCEYMRFIAAENHCECTVYGTCIGRDCEKHPYRPQNLLIREYEVQLETMIPYKAPEPRVPVEYCDDLPF